jgi:hypothetical protein
MKDYFYLPFFLLIILWPYVLLHKNDKKAPILYVPIFRNL